MGTAGSSGPMNHAVPHSRPGTMRTYILLAGSMSTASGGVTVARTDVRARMAAGAARLLAERGLEGTSFAAVLARTGSPRGSTYHHFPDGKVELVHAALDVASDEALAFMEPVRGQPPVAVVRRFVAMW